MNRPLLESVAFACVLCASARANAAPPASEQCLVASETGQDLRRTGQLHAAIERFDSCAASACPPSVREDCVRRREETRRAIPSVRFVVADRHGERIPNVDARLDGRPISTPLEHPLDLEPGEHAFDFVARGFAPVTKRLTILEGLKGREELVILTASPAPSNRRSDQLESTDRGALQKTAAYVAAGTGIVGLGLGTIMWFVAGATYADARKNCSFNTMACANADAVAEGESAHRQLLVSNVALGVGVALVVAGVVLFLTSPAEPHPSSRWPVGH